MFMNKSPSSERAGDGDSGLSGTSCTSTFRGSRSAPSGTASCWWWSILQQENFRPWNYDPLLLSRLLFSMTFCLFHQFHFTLFRLLILRWMSQIFTYQNQTPTLTVRHLFLPRKALLRGNAAEWRIWKREERTKNADLIIFLNIYKFHLPNQFF